MKTKKIAYHYTSVESLFKILGIRGDSIYCRATHAHFLNDPSEYEYAIEIFLESMEEYEKQKNIKIRKSDLRDEAINFLSGLSQMSGDPFLMSFSMSPDDLAMWRTYGKDGSGVAIGFDSDMLSKKEDEPNTKFIECIYDKRTLISELVKFWESEYDKINIEKNNNSTSSTRLLFSIFDLCYAAKRKPYASENEWRLCKNKTVEDKVEFRVSQNLIIPFIKHKFEKEIIKEIILGPCSNEQLAKKSIELFLEEYDYDLKKMLINASEISYRQL